MYRLRTQITVIGLMAGMMADHYGHGGLGAVVILGMFILLHFPLYGDNVPRET